jgi:membrane protease YdiL (CAAX protease family)
MLRQGGGVAGKGNTLKALGQILLYLVGTVLIGALLAPPLFWVAQAAGAQIHDEALSAFLARTDFQRYFDRAVTVSALLLLWPLMRELRIQNFGYDLGLVRDRRGPRRCGAGFLVALAPLLILGAVLIATGVYKLHSHFRYGKLAWLPFTALVVALIEEFLFRGALQGAVRKTAVDEFAMIAVAVLYAAVHFLKPPGSETQPGSVHWWSGLALLPDTLAGFRQPGLLLGGFTTLLAAGLILGYARDRTRSLWMPVGLHAGWVLGKVGLLEVTRHSAAWPWVGPDILIGLAPLLTLMATGGVVWAMLREAR